jgi:hypothetical protein
MRRDVVASERDMLCSTGEARLPSIIELVSLSQLFAKSIGTLAALRRIR